MYLDEYKTKSKKYVNVWYNFTTLLKISYRMKFVNTNHQFNQQCTMIKKPYFSTKQENKTHFYFFHVC
jgi:hypothetical protein